MRSELGLSGEFPTPEPTPKKCTQHPNCKEGACGFYLGKPHGWRPDMIPDVKQTRGISKGVNRQLEMEFEGMVAKECQEALLKKYRNPYHLMCQGVPIPKAVIEHSIPFTKNVDRMFKKGVVYGQQMFDATGSVDLMVFMPKGKL